MSDNSSNKDGDIFDDVESFESDGKDYQPPVAANIMEDNTPKLLLPGT